MPKDIQVPAQAASIDRLTLTVDDVRGADAAATYCFCPLLVTLCN